MSEMATAVAGTAADLGLSPGTVDETAVEPSVGDVVRGVEESVGAPAPEAETETVEEPQTSALDDLNPELPEDLAAFLSEDDDETEAELEVGTITEEFEDDPEALARELAKTRKQLAFEKEQRVATGRKQWTKEAEQFFPLADAASITAESRREFLKQAKAQHDRAFAHIKPRLDEAEQIRSAAREQALAEERERAAGAWGNPTVTVGAPPPATTADDRLQSARQRRDLVGAVRALIDADAA